MKYDKIFFGDAMIMGGIVSGIVGTLPMVLGATADGWKGHRAIGAKIAIGVTVVVIGGGAFLRYYGTKEYEKYLIK